MCKEQIGHSVFDISVVLWISLDLSHFWNLPIKQNNILFTSKVITSQCSSMAHCWQTPIDKMQIIRYKLIDILTFNADNHCRLDGFITKHAHHVCLHIVCKRMKTLCVHNQRDYDTLDVFHLCIVFRVFLCSPKWDYRGLTCHIVFRWTDVSIWKIEP